VGVIGRYVMWTLPPKQHDIKLLPTLFDRPLERLILVTMPNLTFDDAPIEEICRQGPIRGGATMRKEAAFALSVFRPSARDRARMACATDE